MKKKLLFIFILIFLSLSSCISLEKNLYTLNQIKEIIKDSTIDDDIKNYPSGIPVVIKIPYEVSKNIKLIENYMNGKKNGSYERYYNNNNIAIKGTYKDDTPVGIWEVYDEKGNLLKKDSYEKIDKYISEINLYDEIGGKF